MSINSKSGLAALDILVILTIVLLAGTFLLQAAELMGYF